MKALQYIYTSWPNGSNQKKGYMIYSRSEGITDEESENIRKVMRYQPPMSLVPNPTPEEILDEFPYNFAYFRLCSGRLCLALTTYVGKDYSNRYGNYLIHALVVEEGDLEDYPVEFFGEEFWRTCLTDEELHAESPVPPLESLDIDLVGSMVNEISIEDFAAYHEKETALLIDAYMEAVRKRVPLVLNDTRENLVMWCAVLQEMLPLRTAKELYFSTYAFSPSGVQQCMAEYDCAMTVMGIWQDKTQFDYSSERHASGKVVVDFRKNYVSDNLPRTKTAEKIAADIADGMGEVKKFDDFADTHTAARRADFPLDTAFLHYQAVAGDGSLDAEDTARVLSYASANASEEDNRQLALKLLDRYADGSFQGSAGDTACLLGFLYRYADIMILTVNELLFNVLGRCAATDAGRARQMLEQVEKEAGERYESFEEYFLSSGCIDIQKNLFSSRQEKAFAQFYAELLLAFNARRRNQEEISRSRELLQEEMQALLTQQGSEDLEQRLLDESRGIPELFQVVVGAFTRQQGGDGRERFFRKFDDWYRTLPGEEGKQVLKTLNTGAMTKEAGVHLMALLLKGQKDPLRAFWDMAYKVCGENDNNVDLSELVDALLEEDPSPRSAMKVIGGLDAAFIESGEVRRKLIRQASEISQKELSSLQSRYADTFLDLAGKEGLGDAAGPVAAIRAGQIASDSIRSRSIRNFSELAEERKFSLNGVPQKEYLDILQCYLSSYVSLVTSASDMGKLVRCCFNESCFIGFHNTYLDVLKSIRRQREGRWLDLVAYTCIWLARDSEADSVAKRYRKAFIPYLRKLSEADLGEIRKRVKTACGGKAGDRLFDEVEQRSGLSDRMGSFFRRKI